MEQKDVRMYTNIITPNNPVIFDEAVCNGCNNCIENCSMQVIVPNPVKGKSPIVLYPDECWYGGGCVLSCPSWQEGAIRLNHPLNQLPRWKRKGTGEHFRLHMPDPPPPNTTPPVSGW